MHIILNLLFCIVHNYTLLTQWVDNAFNELSVFTNVATFENNTIL